MIIKNGKSVVAKYFNNKPIIAVYKGVRLIWEYLVSCFAKGYWMDDKPWTDDSGWCD